MANQDRQRSIPLAVARVLVMTFLITLLAFAVALFLSIAGILLVSVVRGGGVDLPFAYRYIALPVSLAVMAVALVLSIRGEVRHFRRQERREESRIRPAA